MNRTRHNDKWNASKTIKEKYGNNFFVKIGAMGGRKSRGGGFTANPELARRAGAKGGKLSHRGQKESAAVKDAKKRVVYAKSRIKYFERKIQEEVYDIRINYLENKLEYWHQELKIAEEKVRKEQQKAE